MRVFYTKKMVAGGRRSSPSASKPERVVNDWIRQGLNIEIVEPKPASISTILQAHDVEYVRRVLTSEEMNGFGDFGQDVIDALPYVVGSVVDAVKYSLKTGKNACAPASGAHHAGYDFGGGFCTFNFLIIAAIEARNAGAKTIGIYDGDAHHANGTLQIIDKLKISWIKHRQRDRGLKYYSLQMKDFIGCDLIIYQAGADALRGDPLGAGYLTIEQLRQRDRIVFRSARAMDIPVVWVCAGGYSDDDTVVKIHRATAEECISVEK